MVIFNIHPAEKEWDANQTWSASTRHILENSLPARAGMELDLQKSRYALFNCVSQLSYCKYKNISCIAFERDSNYQPGQWKTLPNESQNRMYSKKKPHLAKVGIFSSSTK